MSQSELEKIEEENRQLKLKIATAENEELKKALLEKEAAKSDSKKDPEVNTPEDKVTQPVVESENPTESEPSGDENSSTAKESEPGRFDFLSYSLKKKILVLFVFVLVFPISIGAALSLKIIPWYEEKWGDDPVAAALVPGNIQVLNREVVTFTSQEPGEASIDHKALAMNGQYTNPPGIMFGNGSNAPKKVDVYIDISMGQSRDFMLRNSVLFKNLIESGAIQLNIHFVPTGNPMSSYGAEAMAEAVASNPGKAWSYLIEMLKLSSVAQDEEWETEEIPKQLSKLAKKEGINGITKDSITGGSYMVWLLSIGQDPNMSKAGLPGMIVNGAPAPVDTNFNDPDSISAIIGGTQ